MWRPEVDVRCFAQSLFYHLLRKGLSWNLEFTNTARLVASKAQGSACLLSARITHTHNACLAFHVGARDLNSGLRVFVVGTLSAIPRPLTWNSSVRVFIFVPMYGQTWVCSSSFKSQSNS